MWTVWGWDKADNCTFISPYASQSAITLVEVQNDGLPSWQTLEDFWPARMKAGLAGSPELCCPGNFQPISAWRWMCLLQPSCSCSWWAELSLPKVCSHDSSVCIAAEMAGFWCELKLQGPILLPSAFKLEVLSVRLDIRKIRVVRLWTRLPRSCTFCHWKWKEIAYNVLTWFDVF